MTTRRSLARLAATGLALTLGLSGCTTPDDVPADPSAQADETTTPVGGDLAALGAEDLIAPLEATPVYDGNARILELVVPSSTRSRTSR